MEEQERWEQRGSRSALPHPSHLLLSPSSGDLPLYLLSRVFGPGKTCQVDSLGNSSLVLICPSGYSRKRGDGVQQRAWQGEHFHFHCLSISPPKLPAGCWLGVAHGSCRPSSKHLSAWKQLVLTWAGKIAAFQIILNFPEV